MKICSKYFIGGGRGIGMALCRAFAESGANVAILDALEKPDAEYDQLEQYGRVTTYIRYALRIHSLSIDYNY